MAKRPPVTVVLGTEGSFIGAFLRALGEGNATPHTLKMCNPGIEGYIFGDRGLIVCRAPYGLLQSSLHCFAVNSIGYYPSLVVHMGTAGYTGSDLALGSICAASSVYQWDAGYEPVGFELGDAPSDDGKSSVPADLGHYLLEGTYRLPLYSGSSFVALPGKALPVNLVKLIGQHGNGLVDMEGFGVDRANKFSGPDGVDGIHLRLVTSNFNGEVPDLNHTIREKSSGMADVLVGILKQLGRC